MNTISAVSRSALFLRHSMAAALVAGLAASAQAQDKVATGGGNWASVAWTLPNGTATTTPTSGDYANIGNGYVVNYNLAGLTTVTRSQIGSTIGGTTANGTLTISSGTYSSNAAGTVAFQVASSENSVGVLNVNGGRLQTTSASGGSLSIGYGANATGTVNLTSGTIAINNSVIFGIANGASGTMNISGGSLTVVSDILIGRQITGTSTGHFAQSGGTTVVNGNFRVGNATSAGQRTVGTVLLTGGSTQVGGNVIVGRTSSGVDGLGRLTVGPTASLSTTGAASVFTVTGNGEVVFQLGSDDNFTAINLNASTATNALSFGELGAKITVDGSALLFSESYDPINLFTFASGKGPSTTSKNNVVFNFINFAEGLTPSLAWTDTSLQLTVVPEPSTVAMLTAAGLGILVLRRRRRQA